MTRQKDLVIRKYQNMLNSKGDTLVRLLGRFYRSAGLRMTEMIYEKARVHLNVGQLNILQMLCLNGMTGQDLAESLGVSKQAISKSLNELQELGLIRKETSAEDSRAKIIEHTRLGLKVVDYLIEVSIELDEELSRRLGKSHYMAFKRILAAAPESIGLSAH